MAHLVKLKSPAVTHMLNHYARVLERGRAYRRDNIDPAKTALNYALGHAATPDALAERVTQLIASARASHEMVSGRAVRRDAVVLADWVVTRPQDCPEALTGAFFDACLAFCKKRYGAYNVPGGFVHLDEPGEPHMHVPVVPVVGCKLQASKLVTRQDLKTFHGDLQAYLDATLPMHVSVLLAEQDRGLKQLSGLSQGDYVAARRALDATQLRVTQLEGRAAELDEQLEAKQAEKAALEAEIAAETARLESVRRVGDAWRSGELRARSERSRKRANELKPQVRSAKAEVARLDERVGKLESGIERLRGRMERLRTRVEAARTTLAGLKTQAKTRVQAVTRAPGRRVSRSAR